MKTLSSFYTFQKIFEEEEKLASSTHGSLKEVDPSHPNIKKKEILSYFCDEVLSTVFTYDGMRDAIVDSRYNKSNNSLLFMLNNELKNVKELMNIITDIDCVGGIGYAEKDGIKALKLVPKANYDFNY